MSSMLSSLSEAPKVIGAAIFDPVDECIESQLPSPYEPILILDAVEKLRVAFDTFASIGDPGELRSYTGVCEGGGLMLRRVEEHTIVCMIAEDANIVVVNVAMNVVALTLKRRGAPSASSPSGGWSRSGISKVSGSYPAVEDALDIAVVRRLLRLYETHIGPAAKVVLKSTLGRLGASPRTLPRDKYPALVDMLASKIHDSERRHSFVEAARELS